MPPACLLPFGLRPHSSRQAALPPTLSLRLVHKLGVSHNDAAVPGFKYEVEQDGRNTPVTFVEFYHTLRFANWLHNGQGSGDTESGAYTLLGGTPVPSNGPSITRNPGARWFLTSEEEWYKAAFHKNDGVTGEYWDYPTGADMPPTAAIPPGGSNSANFGSVVNDVTDVGAYTQSPGPYGTFDQGGNVMEWNEALTDPGTSNLDSRGIRGGIIIDAVGNLHANVRVHASQQPRITLAFVLLPSLSQVPF